MPSEGLPPRQDNSLEPPLPPVLSPGAGAPQHIGHLHPLTLVMLAVRMVRSFLIPAAVVLLTGSERSLGWFLLVFMAINLAVGLIRYLTFQYRIEGGELITREGIFEKRVRNIPLARVQDLRLEAGLMHRLLGVTDVHVETASGQGAEASLSVLSRADADSLRAAIFGALPEPRLTTAAREETPLLRLSWRDCVMEGLTSNRAASALILVFAGWHFLDDFLPTSWEERLQGFITQSITAWAAPEGETHWAGLAALVLVLFVAGAAFSVIGAVLLFHGFTLVRRGEDLYRAHGLFTRRASSLPRRRIQVLRVEESWLRRWLKLAVVRADTASSPAAEGTEDRGGRDVLVPIVRTSALGELLPEFLPETRSEMPGWKPVARCAVRRGFTKGALLCLAAAAVAVTFQQRFTAAWPIALLPLLYYLSWRSYRAQGYFAGETLFLSRRGWVDRVTHYVPVRNVQVLTVRQTPFDRRYGVAGLQIDTAGRAFTGGSPTVRHLPLLEAMAVSREIARRAARARH